MSISRKQKDLLEPWANIYARLEERLNRMGDAELAELREAAKAASPTNCWCMTLRVAQILAPVAEEVIGHRRYVAEQLVAKQNAD